MFVTECFHNKCFKLSTLHSVYIPWGCELDMILSVMTIICKDWAETKDKAKSLEHIIQKCDPPTPAMPLVTTGATVPGLYSHIAHSVDRDEEEIPPPFKGAKPKQTRGRGKPKGRPQGHTQNPLKDQEADKVYTCDNTNNYYHNENYTAPGQN